MKIKDLESRNYLQTRDDKVTLGWFKVTDDHDGCLTVTEGLPTGNREFYYDSEGGYYGQSEYLYPE